MSRSIRVGTAAFAAMMAPASATAAYDDWTILTPGSTGMMGEWVYDVLYDDATGTTWIAADDPIWDEGGFASTQDGLTWETYSNVNGDVPTHYVDQLQLDDDGNLWMASEAGLLRFDGETTEVVWSTANAPEWPHDGVVDFDWDSRGNLWVALSSVTTVNGGLAKWDGAGWTLYTTATGLPWEDGWDNVSTVTVDSLDRVWIGSDVMGAAMLDGTTWTWFEPGASSLPSNIVYDILVEDDGTAWFATLGGGLARLAGTTWTTWAYSTFSTNDISGLALDHAGNVWATTFVGSAWKYNGAGWSGLGLPLGHVYGLDFDADGNPIASGIGGLVLGDGQLYTPFAVSLSDRWIDAIELADDGRMWRGGGGGGGVSVYDGVTWQSWNPYNEDLYAWPFATDAVEDIVEGLDGHIFVNAINHGIGEWDGSRWIRHIATQSIEVMALAPDGSLWAGPYNGTELATYDGSRWRQVNIPYTGFAGDLYSLAIDPAGDVWLGSIQGLLYSGDNGSTWQTFNTTNSDLPGNYVFAIEPEPDGSGIWLGTENGLAFFDGVDWTIYTETDGLPADTIGALAIAADGALWVGAFESELWPYYGGLARFDGTTWRTWTTENSALPHEQISSIAFDADENVWVGTQSEGIGVLFANGASLTTHPTAFRVTTGARLEGSVAAMASSDDVALWVDSAASGTRLVSATSIDLASPVVDPASLTISVELSAEGPLTASFAIRNARTGAWDPIGTATRVTALRDQTVVLTVSDASDYVSATGPTKLRISTRAAAAANPSGVAVGIDEIEMAVTE